MTTRADTFESDFSRGGLSSTVASEECRTPGEGGGQAGRERGVGW